MAEAAGWYVLGPHEVVDSCAKRFLPISSGWGFRLEAHDLAGAVEDLCAMVGRDDLSPGVRVGVLAGAAVEVAEEAEIEVRALRATDVAVPDGGAAEITGGDDGVGECDALNGGGGGVVYGFIVDHLAEEAGEKGKVGRQWHRSGALIFSEQGHHCACQGEICAC